VTYGYELTLVFACAQVGALEFLKILHGFVKKTQGLLLCVWKEKKSDIILN